MTEMKPYMTDKRKYERPTMRVVELQRHAPLICTSGDGLGERPDYTPDDTNPFGGG